MLAQEQINVIDSQALTVGSKTTFSREFPLAQGWYKMILRIGINLTVGTGAGPISEGELRFVKNVYLKTDRGEVLCDLPGRALYKIAATKAGILPDKDAIQAADGTYYVTLPIYFYDPLLSAPMATILDTARYNALTLDVQLGSVGDLLTTPGTASVTATLDVEVLRTKDVLPEEFGPLAHISYAYMQPQDASVQTYVDIERSQDLSIKRLMVHSGGSGTSGEPFTGDNDDTIISRLSFSDSAGYIVQKRIAAMIQDDNRHQYSLDSKLAGIYQLDFCADADIESAIWTGDRAKLVVHWDNASGVTSGDIVSVAVEGIRALK